MDAIREVGPGGSFLGHKHTRKYMRERWQPTLFDRRPYNIWEEKRDGARQWAKEKAQQILKDYHPDPLEAGLKKELQKIVKSAE
jgi:trimethylamine--corrinoid protein Co-methyltransferase